MSVGDTRTMQALNSSGQPVTGLTWASSDSNIVSLSTDDPPVLTAVAAGHATITAGGASADITVVSGALALGTILWSNPGGASGVYSIVPAVPSPNGVADVFAFQNDSTVQAITSDGTTAWTANLSNVLEARFSDLRFDLNAIPDFQGGLVLAKFPPGNCCQLASIVKLDGITGQPGPAYTPSGTAYLYLDSPLVVHPDGTIFALQTVGDPDPLGNYAPAVIGIDSATGAQKFSVPLENFNPDYSGEWGPTPRLIIAGDGNAYVAYSYPVGAGASVQLSVLRVSSSGDHATIPIQSYPVGIWFFPQIQADMITNADTGVALTWKAARPYAPEGGGLPNRPAPYPVEYGMAIVTGTSAAVTSGPSVAGQVTHVAPVLQAEDGSFIGTVGVAPDQDGNPTRTNMVAFDQSGAVRWIVPNEQPQIAVSGGGVITQTGTTHDQGGNATGLSSLESSQVPGWLGNVFGTAYALNSGTLSSAVSQNTNYATTFASLLGGNGSGSFTAILQVITKPPQTGAKQLPNLSSASCLSTFTPTCGNINAVELLTTASPDFIFQNYIQTFLPVTALANPRNPVMTFTGPGGSNTINVTGAGQTLTIALRGFDQFLQNPFQVMTERFDPTAHTISVVTLAGHPLAGWRYWRVYSIGTNDVVIETGAYDQPGPGAKNFAGYYVATGSVFRGWQKYLEFIQSKLPPGTVQGSHLQNSLGGIPLRNFPVPHQPLLKGYWDHLGDFTQYILNNVCQSTSCN
ncbi:MAG: hypothetical protein LAP38_01005 [Acidobacteriia bacterium]|nr:hypothetical protein [Terriglobia bacterium]